MNKKKNLDNYIIKYMQGDETAFDILYSETKETAFLSIYAIIKNKIQIEDLMQDVYMKVIDNLQNYQLGTNFKAWVARIARNIAINFYNKNKRDVIADPDEIIIIDKNESNNTPLLDFALSILDGDEKEIFVYKIILNMTFQEIGKIMDLPTARIFYLYNQSIKKIKKQI